MWILKVFLIAPVFIAITSSCHRDPGALTYKIKNCVTLTIAGFEGWKNITKVEANSNKIPTLRNGSFTGGGGIETIILNDCEIRTIEVNAFEGLVQLKDLYLQFNRIRRLIPGTFDSLANLEVISLAQNEISVLEGQLFAKNPVLRSLYFEYNEIVAVDRKVLDGINVINYNLAENVCVDKSHTSLTNAGGLQIVLEKSTCYENHRKFQEFKENAENFPIVNECHRVASIPIYYNIENCYDIKAPGFKNWKDVKYVDGSHNKLTILKDKTFVGGSTIISIDFQDNKIRSIEIDFFEGLTHLRELNLERNNLKSLKVGIFDELKNLREISLSLNHLTVVEGDLLLKNGKLNTIFVSNNELIGISSKFLLKTNVTAWNFENNFCIHSPLTHGTKSDFMAVLKNSNCYQFHNGLDEFNKDVQSLSNYKEFEQINRRRESKNLPSDHFFTEIAIFKCFLFLIFALILIIWY